LVPSDSRERGATSIGPDGASRPPDMELAPSPPLTMALASPHCEAWQGVMGRKVRWALSAHGAVGSAMRSSCTCDARPRRPDTERAQSIPSLALASHPHCEAWLEAIGRSVLWAFGAFSTLLTILICALAQLGGPAWNSTSRFLQTSATIHSVSLATQLEAGSCAVPPVPGEPVLFGSSAARSTSVHAPVQFEGGGRPSGPLRAQAWHSDGEMRSSRTSHFASARSASRGS
jgi:hypothetical protein